MAHQFPNLFREFKIGPVTVKNRIYFPPHGTAFIDHVNQEYALPNEKLAGYLAERAKGGAGLVFLDLQAYHPSSYFGAGNLLSCAWMDEIVPRYRMIADAVHAQGAKLFAQVVHMGGNAPPYGPGDPGEVWVPSVIPGIMMYSRYGANYGMPKAMEKEDIKALLDGLRKVAANARKGGLDGLELHACHGYLLGEFMSPMTNRRKDEYGGSFENRMRLVLECLDVMHSEIKPEMALGMRISGDEFTPNGMTIEDNKAVARAFDASGKLDYISISGGSNWTLEGTAGIVAPSFVPAGFLVPFAAEIKRSVKMPVFCAGRINDPVIAEKVLADGQADMIGMARPLIADAELPLKSMEGKADDIRPCVGCMQGCMGRFLHGMPITCIQNPAVGKEKRFGMGTLKPAARARKILVVGGGPAGLKAAETAARRGHQVTLYEKESELGGQVRLAALTPSRVEFGNITQYLAKQVQKLGVAIRTGSELTAEMVQAEKADAVILATGAEALRGFFDSRKFADVRVPGLDQPNVVTIWDILLKKVNVGASVLIVDGEGHYRTLAVADLLVDQGKKVEVLTPTRTVMSEVINTVDGPMMFRRLREKNVVFTSAASVKEISGKRVTTSSRERPVIDGVDTIVWALACKANDRLYFELKGKVRELYRVGDCVAPRFVESAIWEGEMAGRRV